MTSSFTEEKESCRKAAFRGGKGRQTRCQPPVSPRPPGFSRITVVRPGLKHPLPEGSWPTRGCDSRWRCRSWRPSSRSAQGDGLLADGVGGAVVRRGGVAGEPGGGGDGVPVAVVRGPAGGRLAHLRPRKDRVLLQRPRGGPDPGGGA